MKFKVGDRVVSYKDESTFKDGHFRGIIDHFSPTGNIYVIADVGSNYYASYHELIHEDTYDSPLFQLMQEDD